MGRAAVAAVVGVAAAAAAAVTVAAGVTVTAVVALLAANQGADMKATQRFCVALIFPPSP